MLGLGCSYTMIALSQTGTYIEPYSKKKMHLKRSIVQSTALLY